MYSKQADQMDMEIPKNYSNVYCEERAPKPAIRGTTSSTKTLDGSFSTRRHRESVGGINPNDLLPRLYHLSQEQQNSYSIITLRQQFKLIQERNKQTYKVYINYWDKKETFLVRTERNTLRDVKTKLPIKGDYRLFFIHPGNECEEVEDDECTLPYHEKEGSFIIYCRVFAK